MPQQHRKYHPKSLSATPMTALGTGSVTALVTRLPARLPPPVFSQWANTSVLEKSVVKGDLAAKSVPDTLTNSASL